MKKLVVGLCLFAQLSAAASAETLLEDCQRLEREVVGLQASSPPPQAQGDLSHLSDAVKSLEAFLTGPDPTCTVAQLDQQKDLLESARMALRISASSDPTLLSLQERTARLRQRLLERENSFDGRDLPSRQELARTPVEVAFHRPVYEGPRELFDDARTVRAGVNSLYRPRALLGGGSPWGTAPWFGNDANDLMVAAADFETRCQSSYKNVRETIPAYQRLARAYRRAGSVVWTFNDTFDARRLERSMERLGKFYTNFVTK